ncbi:heterokaryon incompatibility protein-domain-containing protein [Nemania abortiva]|nr:heterokaryon incompatibility protein-domain-containing protein [Nemania abortiva]
MNQFPYVSLQRGRKIRLLKLAGGRGDRALKGELIHADLNLDLEYSALSYVWGSELAGTKIECNGHEVEIGKNLAEALRHIRHESESRYIWVDALCINQQDMGEKGHQVALMKDIYAYAWEVDVWLGPDEEGSAAGLFSEVENLVTLLEVQVKEDFNSLNGEQWHHFRTAPFPILRQLSLLFKRQYFTRTWVIQEVGLTNRPVAHCGKAVINFNKPGLLAMAFVKYLRPTLSSFGYLTEFELTDSRDKVYAFISHPSAQQGADRFLGPGEGMPAGRNMTDEDVKLRVLSIIFAPANVTRRLAGLHHIGDHPPGPASPDQVVVNQLLENPGPHIRAPRYWPGSSFIKPDYNLSVVDVYLDFARQMIRRTESLEVLSFVQHPASLPPTGPGFPSWVPRWDALSDVSILGGRNCDHFATANRRQIISPSPNHSSLVVRGLFFDRVGFHTIPLTREDLTDDSKTSPLWTMSKTCQVATYPVPEYPRIYAPGVVLTQDPDRMKAYRRTWVAGRTIATGNADSDDFNPDVDFAAHQLDYLRNKDKDQPFTDLPHMIRMAALESEAKGGDGQRYAEAAGRVCHGRCFFITKGGFFGIGPGILQPDDAVALLLGADVPFILREKEKCGDNFGGWALIGECYVHGIMTGDAIRAWGGSDGDLVDITLC